MLLRYEVLGDVNLIFLPDTRPWRIVYQELDDKGYDDCSVYLVMGSEKIKLCDGDWYRDGRDITETQIGCFYNDMIDEIKRRILESGGKIQCIDLEEIQSKLLKEKYFEKWREAGCIHVDEDGSW